MEIAANAPACKSYFISVPNARPIHHLQTELFVLSLNNKKTDLVLIRQLLYRITKMYIYCFSDILIAAFT